MVAFARRSPRARLYSLVPRSSQCPSTRTSMFSCDFSQAALASSIFASVGRMSYLSKSKKTSFRSAIAANSRGTGRALPLALPLGVAVPPPAPLLPPGCIPAVPPDPPEPPDDPVAPATPVGAGAEAAVVAARRPAGLGVVAAVRELPDTCTLGVHQEHVRAAGAIADEGDLLSRRRPRGLGVDAGVPREPPQRTGGQRQRVDLRIAVLGQRHRQPLAVGTEGR